MKNISFLLIVALILLSDLGCKQQNEEAVPEFTFRSAADSAQYYRALNEYTQSARKLIAIDSIRRASTALWLLGTYGSTANERAVALHKLSAIDTITDTEIMKLFDKMVSSLHICTQLHTPPNDNRPTLGFGIYLQTSQQLLSEADIGRINTYELNTYYYADSRGVHYVAGNTKNADSLKLYAGSRPVVCNTGTQVVYANNRISDLQRVYLIQAIVLSKPATAELLSAYTSADTEIYCDTTGGVFKYFIGRFDSHEGADKFKSAKQLHQSFILSSTPSHINRLQKCKD